MIRNKLLLLIVCLSFSALSYAEMAEIKVANNQIGFQVMILNVDYMETGNGTTSGTGKLDTETGAVPGKALFISRMWGNSNAYFEAQYSRCEGSTDYVGALLSGGPYGSVVSKSGAILSDYSARLGKGFAVGHSGLGSHEVNMLTPYAELGHHEWYRGVNAGETYSHHYYGVGILWQYSPVNSRMVLSVNGLAGKTFGSYIDVTGYFSGELGNSTVYKAGLGLDYALTKIIHVNIGAEYTSFAYGISDSYPSSLGPVLEPDSTSAYLIYKAGLGFAF